jgi:hypothetical protein
MRIDESEWVVRDLAQQVHDLLIEGSAYLPNTTPPSYLAPWLHAFTSKQELPTPIPESSLEMLLLALERGSDEQILASLIHLQSEGKPQIIPQVSALFSHPSPDIRQQALITAWVCVPPNFIIEEPST